ncbi:CMGC/SRPK protein kinase [Capronia epimyces CBS 606.96]|uniref:CMGC/SRPK protein kinase n=1 Tax=Capronia epimyces CBS 606.96 TaxID=1182542 RepID=W9XIG0_9EURO|nr:CMGC/SRPK protein kinase [Capronia epimyces CBS 606.96]EXJ79988.1 CMGC/SRPK protein kinase [Capronia epimyces CBS 606.96]
MTSLFQSWRYALRRKPSLPRTFPSIGALLIPAETLFEEETLPFYEPQQYYPVHIGDVYQSKYQVVGKLGYGAYSTVWLCRDLCKFPDATLREFKIYEHLSSLVSSHPGQSLIRGLCGTFELHGPSGKHQCLLQPPMHMSLLDMTHIAREPFSLPLLKMTLKRLLTALDFLHTEAQVVHGDLKTDNLMLNAEDPTMLERFEEAEIKEPSPRKLIDSSRTIYKSRCLPTPRDDKYGLPILCDFGEARIGETQESGPFVQPHIYRAPEVIFEMPWGPPIDIWNLAGLVWDLLEGEHLFGRIFDDKGQHDPFQHIASMVNLIGQPPTEFVRRSETTEQCFDAKGDWIAEEHGRITAASLEDIETRLVGQEKEVFLNFMRSMLKWLPEERSSANELLDDPWLQD